MTNQTTPTVTPEDRFYLTYEQVTHRQFIETAEGMAQALRDVADRIVETAKQAERRVGPTHATVTQWIVPQVLSATSNVRLDMLMVYAQRADEAHADAEAVRARLGAEES